jgi:hypothetical protein
MAAEAIFGDSKLTTTNLPGSFPDRQIFATVEASRRTTQSANTQSSNAQSSADRPRWLRLKIAPAITLH